MRFLLSWNTVLGAVSLHVRSPTISRPPSVKKPGHMQRPHAGPLLSSPDLQIIPNPDTRHVSKPALRWLQFSALWVSPNPKQWENFICRNSNWYFIALKKNIVIDKQNNCGQSAVHKQAGNYCFFVVVFCFGGRASLTDQFSIVIMALSISLSSCFAFIIHFKSMAVKSFWCI